MPSTCLHPAASPTGPAHLAGGQLPHHLARLHRAARILTAGERRGDGDADDLVQDTLERVLRRPRVVSGDPAAYLLQALRRTHLDRRRAQRARITTVREPEHADAADPRVTEDPVLRLQARAVLSAIGDLPDPFRQAVVALDVAGYSAREAAARLGVPRGTLESRAHRGRARVAAAVER